MSGSLVGILYLVITAGELAFSQPACRTNMDRTSWEPSLDNQSGLSGGPDLELFTACSI